MARILVTGFCSLPGPDRAGVQLRHIVDALSARHQVDVLTLRREDQAYVERVRQARILRVPMNASDRRKQIEAFQRALRRQLEGAEYDIVHFRDAWSGKVVLENQARGGYVTVFDATRSPMAEASFRDHGEEAQLERLCVQRVDMVLAPSSLGADALARISSADKVQVVPPGVNVDSFDWEHPPTSGPPVILYLGTLSKGRGIQLLLRSMYQLAKQSEAVLVLAGESDEPFRGNLQRAVDELELADRVRVLGPVSHDLAAAIIGRATVCVAPAAAEVESKATVLYPTKLLEYLACKRAVVAPHRSSVTMLLRHEQNALLFKPGSPDDLTAQLLRLLRNASLRERIAQNGYDLVRVAATASNTRRALRKAYRWLVEREDIKQRLAAAQVDEYRPEVVTDLAIMLDISTPNFAQALEEDTVIVTESQPQEVGGDVTDVTRVEMNPLIALQEHEASEEAESSGSSEQGPMTNELEVIEDLIVEEDVDTGRVAPVPGADTPKVWPRFDDPKAEDKTGTDTDALAVPGDKSRGEGRSPFNSALVAGEVRAKAPRPDLSKPIQPRTSVRIAAAPEAPGEDEPAPVPRPPRVPGRAKEAKRRAASPPPRSLREGLHEEPTAQISRIRDLKPPSKSTKS